MRTIQFPAFHGTMGSFATKISENKAFQSSKTRDDHWLGHGSYFFREDFEQAWIWAKNRYDYEKENEGESPTVVEVIVEVPENHILNLDSRAGLDFLSSYMDDLYNRRKLSLKAKGEIAKNAKVACFVLSSISEEVKWVISKTFPVPSIYDRSSNLKNLQFKHKKSIIGFGLQAHQVCVKNKKAIKEESIKTHTKPEELDGFSVIPTKKEMISNELFS